MQKRHKTAIESGALLLIAAAILIALNALSALGVYKRIDATKNEKYTLSKGSANLLKNAKQNFMVEAYVTRGLPKLDAFVSDVKDLLNEYKRAGEGKFDFVMIEPKGEDDQARKKAKEAGLQEHEFLSASEDKTAASASAGFMGLIINYGADKDIVENLIQNPADPRADGLEFWISNKLREIRDKGDGIEHKIGVLVGHDDLRLNEKNLLPVQPQDPRQPASAQDILQGVFKYLKISDVDLGGGGAKDPKAPKEATPPSDPKDIDATYDGIIITQPGKDYSEDELKKIDDFVLRGKSLVVVAGAANMKAGDSQMTATLDLHGLDKLLSAYGLDLGKDVIIDPGASMKLPQRSEMGQEKNIVFPQFLFIQDDSRLSDDEKMLDTEFAPFFRLSTIQLPFASSITMHPEKQPDAKFEVHARTSPQAGRITQNGALSPFEASGTKFRKFPKPGEPKQLNVVVSVEGTMASAFKDGVKGTKPSRILLISSPQYFANPLARAASMPQDPAMHGMHLPPDRQLAPLSYIYLQLGFEKEILSLRNLIDWMSGEEDLNAVSAKLISDPPLVFGNISKPNDNETDEEYQARQLDGKKTLQVVITWSLTLAIPALVALIGVLRWQLRVRSRQSASLA